MSFLRKKLGKYCVACKKFFSKKTNRVLFLVSTLIVILGTLFLFVLSNISEQTMMKQSYERGQIVSSGGKKAVTNYFTQLENSLTMLPQNPQVAALSPEAQFSLERFVSHWQTSALAGMIVTDDQGIVVLNANRLHTNEVGENVSDRDFFLWAKTAARLGDVHYGKVIVSRFGVAKDQLILTVSTPLYENANFKGVITVAVLVSEIGNILLEPIKGYPGTQVWLFNQEGTMLYGPSSEFYGQNVYKILDQTQFPGSQLIKNNMSKVLQGKASGTYDWIVPDFATRTLKRFLITHESINLPSNHWTLAILIPMSEIRQKLAPLEKNYIIAYVFVLAVVLVFSALIIVGVRLAQREAYNRGFVEGGEYERQNIKQHNKKDKKSST